MKRFILFCFFLACIHSSLFSESMFKHSLNFDIGGPGNLLTAEYNYEILSDTDWALTMSAGIGPGGMWYSIPLGFNYIRGTDNQLILGLHSMPIWVYDFDDCYNTDWITCYALSPRAGFRRQLSQLDEPIFVHIYLSPLFFMNRHHPQIVITGGFGFGWYFE